MILVAALQPFAGRKVRTVARYGDAELMALVDIASNNQNCWEGGEWDRMLADIDDCEQSVQDWANGLRVQRQA